MSLHLLIATIPSRRAPCERLLGSLVEQTRHPDVVHLVLDGYGDEPRPQAPPELVFQEWRTATRLGPGGRWRVVKSLAPEDVVVVLDDDVVVAQAPGLVESLARAAEFGDAVSTRGVTVAGKFALAQAVEDLICMGAASMAVKAGNLYWLNDLAADVQEKCGFDPLGDCGDDEALVSAHLWMQGVRMRQICALEIQQAHDSQVESQTTKRILAGRPFWWQREAIAQLTGWPWRLAD